MSQNKLEQLIQQVGKLKSVAITVRTVRDPVETALEGSGSPLGSRRAVAAIKSAESNLTNAITELQAILADMLLDEREAELAIAEDKEDGEIYG